MHRDFRWPIEDGGLWAKEASRGVELRGSGVERREDKDAEASRRSPRAERESDRVQSSQQAYNPANWMTSGGCANGWSARWEEGEDERKV